VTATGDDAASERFAEVLKLAFVVGLSVRAISRRLHMARKTVRRVLDRDGGKRARRRAAPRPTLLGASEERIRRMLSAVGHADLGGHPKPASRGHLKTGQS
jgi:hypothetical protein